MPYFCECNKCKKKNKFSHGIWLKKKKTYEIHQSKYVLESYNNESNLDIESDLDIESNSDIESNLNIGFSSSEDEKMFDLIKETNFYNDIDFRANVFPILLNHVGIMCINFAM
ncbi:hypothetical protein Glove_122g150 [Diversispora epigaea]|uniref:Uncharacterized protein n=1 Tax=Diversispora epigaea TaxID=1348612 RepID=A0A397J3E8_9GLOM|nr:hypothetical protein Glove_122g150 [Diversispora epigaea]